MLRKIFQPLYTSYVMLLFAVSVILVFPVYLLLSLFHKKTSRIIMWYIAHFWARRWLLIIGMPVRRRGKIPPRRTYIIIANHISYLDPLVIYAVLPWYFRPLAKIEMSKIPVFGFIYAQMALMVDRNSMKSRARSMQLMYETLKESNIFIYPEGTFNETGQPVKEFYDGAFRLAINTGTPILPLILHDTVHRWNYTAWWKVWPGKNHVTFLQPIEVTGLQAQDLKMLKQRVHHIMSDALSGVE